MPRLFGAACFLDAGLTHKIPNRYPSESRVLCSLLDSLSMAQSTLKQRDFSRRTQVTWLQRTLSETSHEMERIC